MRTRSFDYDAIRTFYAAQAGFKYRRMRRTAEHFDCSMPTVTRALRAVDQRGDGASTTMGPSKGGKHGATSLPRSHPAVLEARTIFPLSVVEPAGEASMLKPGSYHAKLGARVQKGEWAGYPIFTLTLQERATCPASCTLWASCYGNASPYARRLVHGDELEARLALESAQLANRHPGGFAVRLHNLGDFYSVDYVRLWLAMVDVHAALHVFGYTAHVDTETDPIAREIVAGADARWPRFAIRRSAAWTKTRSTVVIEHEAGAPADAIVCPAQTGKTTSCSTCALCWSTDKRIAFLRH